MSHCQFCPLSSWNYQVLSSATFLLSSCETLDQFSCFLQWIFKCEYFLFSCSFFLVFFIFISTVHVFVMEIPHLLFSLFLVKTLMRQKCVHESFTRNKGQVWVWARSSLRKLERKLDHMELRLNFLVEKASWGPRGSPHKKVARSFSPSKIFLMQNLTITIKIL